MNAGSSSSNDQGGALRLAGDASASLSTLSKSSTSGTIEISSGSSGDASSGSGGGCRSGLVPFESEKRLHYDGFVEVSRLLTPVKVRRYMRPSIFLSFPQDATAIASQIGAGAGHGPSTGVVSAMDGTINELVRHAYTSAFHSIFAVLAVLSVLTAVVCILTLRRSADQQAYLWSLEAQANERNNNYWKLSDMDYAICAASWPSPKNCTSPAQQRSCTSSSRPCRAPSRN